MLRTGDWLPHRRRPGDDVVASRLSLFKRGGRRYLLSCRRGARFVAAAACSGRLGGREVVEKARKLRKADHLVAALDSVGLSAGARPDFPG